MKRILFLCTGNSARSQMAEGFAKVLARDVEAYSAGTEPAARVNPFAIRVMAEKGIDISQNKPKMLSVIAMPIDLIVAVCSHAAENCPVVPGAATERWDLPDAAAFQGSDEETLEVFRQSRDEIERRVRSLAARI